MMNTVIVPSAVVAEIAAGVTAGVDLPNLADLDWVTVRRPASPSSLRLVTDLGAGETEVLALALESADAVVILDDKLARRVAQALGVRFTGTLGVLLDAKRAGLIPHVAPTLDQLDALGFRIARTTRELVLRRAGESA